MRSTTHLSANIVASVMAGHDIKYVVVSPGSRNTPLLVAVSRHEKFRIIPVVDERIAAFVAVGLAERQNEPVALICTSGTAVLNYAPAVAEAYYRNIPLLVISADRPAEWIDQYDGQTIRQSGVLGNIIKASYNIPVESGMTDYDLYVNRIVNEAINTTITRVPGPVHLNIQFDTPLGDLHELNLNSAQTRIIRNVAPRPLAESSLLRPYLDILRNSRIMVVVGFHTPDARLSKALKRLAEHENVLIVHEAQSNVNGIPNSIDNPEALFSTLDVAEKKTFMPELLLSMGGSVLSSSLKSFLRNNDYYIHWLIGPTRDDRLIDTFKHLTLTLDVDEPSFFNTLSSLLRRYPPTITNYQSTCIAMMEIIRSESRRYISGTSWCDMKAVNCLVDNLPKDINLQVSNGMSIRYLQNADYQRVNRIGCNRGCSGIDGCTSTAIGAAIDCHRPTVLLTGDMSVHYDIGALSTDCIPSNFSIFILKNRGGDIFRVVKSTRDLEECETLMAMFQTIDYKGIALACGFEFVSVCDCDQLKRECRRISLPRTKPLFVEIDTAEADNAGHYRQYFQYLKNLITTNPNNL